MSRILIHSNAPWVPSGYGKQCAHLVRILRGLGHEVVVSAFSGLTGAPLDWHGTTVLPAGMYEYGVDVLLPHMDAVQPDLTIALMDVWKLGPLAEALRGRTMAAWVPVDCTPLSQLDRHFFQQSGVHPIAMSQFGRRQLAAAGFGVMPQDSGLTTLPEPFYAPHVVDREVFKPLTAENRAGYRQGLGLDGRFVIGLCAANNDATRKGFPEQFEAFRRFHKRHPEALLMVHAIARSARGLDLERLAGEIGIEQGAIRITDTYPQLSGAFDDTLLADWYGMLDVLTACSYAEAFGVPLIEAQACGTPVVTTYGSATRELRGRGWLVQGDPYWNHVHGAWWERPQIDSIVRQYEKAYEHAADYREAARTFSYDYDASSATIADRWAHIVKTLCG